MTRIEEFTNDELEMLHTLQAKQKRIQRASKRDALFLEEADRRRDELLARWGMSVSDDTINDIELQDDSFIKSISFI